MGFEKLREYSLEEILEREQNRNLILDTSVLTIPGDFFREIYGFVDFSQFDLQKLNENITYLRKINEILSLKNIFIVEQTLENNSHFQEIISEKAKNLNDYYYRSSKRAKFLNNVSNRGLFRDKEKGLNRHEIVEEKRNAFSELCLLSQQINKKTKNKVYVPENMERYKKMFNLVEMISRKLRISHQEGPEPSDEIKLLRNEYNYNGKDETIVAMLLDSSFGNPVDAISVETRLSYFFCKAFSLIASRELNPSNEYLANTLRKNPVTLFTLCYDDGNWRALETSHLNPSNFIKLDSFNDKEIDRITKEIRSYLFDIQKISSNGIKSEVNAVNYA